MNVSFRQLQLFLAVAETGSVSAAARRLHVTQPTASMQLRDMSETIGMPLYEIVGKKLYLTAVGTQLAETARAIAQQWESFEQAANGARGLTRGKLRVAVVSTAEYFMPRLIGNFCTQYPEIDVALSIHNRDGVVQRLRENLDDLYIMSMPPSELDLHDSVFMDNPLVLVAAARHPLVRRKGIQLADLATQRFLLREPGSGTRMAGDRHFAEHNFHPQIRMELGSNEAIKEAVAGGLGIGLLSRHTLHGLAKEHGVAMLDVAGFPIHSQWHIVYPAGKRLSPLAKAFHSQLLLPAQR